MMVEQSPYTSVKQWVSDLDRATQKLENINNHLLAMSEQELTELIDVFQQVNTSFDSSLLKDRTFVTPEGMNQKLEKILNAIQLFQRNHPTQDRSNQRNVDQAIASLVFSLRSAMTKFDKNLRDLKKYKIGQKVEKAEESGQGKQSMQ